MHNLIINTFFVLLLSTCVIVLGLFNMQKQANFTYVNGKLYDLEQVLDALDVLQQPQEKNQAVKEKLETILATNLLDLSTKSININNLQERPTDVLCRILHYHKTNEIGDNNTAESKVRKIMELLPEYLISLEKSLRSKSENSTTPYHHCNAYFGLEEKQSSPMKE